jgi:hypothetical protein
MLVDKRSRAGGPVWSMHCATQLPPPVPRTGPLINPLLQSATHPLLMTRQRLPSGRGITSLHNTLQHTTAQHITLQHTDGMTTPYD